MKKLKIGVFTGGRSSEREISLESGRHVYNNLDSEKYERIPLFVDLEGKVWEVPEASLWMNTTSDIAENLGDAKRVFYDDFPKKIDFAFLTLHGKFGEDCFPGLLKTLGVPNNGAGVLGGALAMDKFMQRKLLSARGLGVPKYISLEKSKSKIGSPRANWKLKIAEDIGFPCIVKPSREGCSIALTRVDRKEELDAAFTEAFKYDNLILVEGFLEGKEITTTVLGNEAPEALLPTETPSKGDYLTVEEKFLPGDAKMITPPDLPEDVIKSIQEQCVRAYKALALKVFARIDAFWTNDGRFVILEANSLPGMTPSTCIFHQAAEAGMNVGQFFDKVIEFSLEACRAQAY